VKCKKIAREIIVPMSVADIRIYDVAHHPGNYQHKFVSSMGKNFSGKGAPAFIWLVLQGTVNQFHSAGDHVAHWQALAGIILR